MIGRYIDQLTDEERDRIITAQDWVPNMLAFADGDGNRCLCGHVERWSRFDATDHAAVRRRARFENRYRRGRRNALYTDVAVRAIDVCLRMGQDRFVRAVKMRAAKGTPLATAVPVREEVVHA